MGDQLPQVLKDADTSLWELEKDPTPQGTIQTASHQLKLRESSQNKRPAHLSPEVAERHII